MKKLFMALLLILSIIMVGCDYISFYSINVEYDNTMGEVIVSGFTNDENKYIGDVKVEVIAYEGYEFSRMIDKHSLEVHNTTKLEIEMISRNILLKVEFTKKEDNNSSNNGGNNEGTIGGNNEETTGGDNEETTGGDINIELSNTYYKNINEDLIGKEMKTALRELITITHKKITSYDDCKKKDYILKTDGDPEKPGNIILFWSNLSIPWTWDGGKTWNREHVWPQSQGWFKTSQAGADLHHIRPTDSSVNTSHGNDPYGIVSGGSFVKTSKYNSNIITGCKKGGGMFEPVDNRKGDCARIIFYLLIRYSQSDAYSITNVAQSMDVLLEWNDLDPVDQYEINRNEAVFEIQGNRNPFIDCSDLADVIWG